MTTPSRRRTDRARVEQCRDALRVTEAWVAAREAIAAFDERELFGLPEGRDLFVALQRDMRVTDAAAVRLTLAYAEKWPRAMRPPTLRPDSDPTMRVKDPQDGRQRNGEPFGSPDTDPPPENAQSASQPDSTQPTNPKGT